MHVTHVDFFMKMLARTIQCFRIYDTGSTQVDAIVFSRIILPDPSAVNNYMTIEDKI